MFYNNGNPNVILFLKNLGLLFWFWFFSPFFFKNVSILQSSFNHGFHNLFIRLAEVKEKTNHFKKVIQRLDTDLENHQGNITSVVVYHAGIYLEKMPCPCYNVDVKCLKTFEFIQIPNCSLSGESFMSFEFMQIPIHHYQKKVLWKFCADFSEKLKNDQYTLNTGAFINVVVLGKLLYKKIVQFSGFLS